MTEIKAGSLVQARYLPAWGVGKVREVLGDRFTVRFEGTGRAVEEDFVLGELEPVIERATA